MQVEHIEVPERMLGAVEEWSPELLQYLIDSSTYKAAWLTIHHHSYQL